MVRVLLEHDADADREDGGGRTPRTMAGQLGHHEMQQLFGSSHQGAVLSPMLVFMPETMV
jgi:hypothetical protein